MTHDRDKFAVFASYAPWNWVYASSAYTDESSAETRRLLLVFSALGLLAVAMLALVWWWLARRMIVHPIGKANRMAAAIAGGNLTMHIKHQRKDEIGGLLDNMKIPPMGWKKWCAPCTSAPTAWPSPAPRSRRATTICPAAPKARPARCSKPRPRWSN
jgi:HAMP domain-containing protein